MTMEPTKTEIAIFGLIFGFTFAIGSELAERAWNTAARAFILLFAI